MEYCTKRCIKNNLRVQLLVRNMSQSETLLHIPPQKHLVRADYRPTNRKASLSTGQKDRDLAIVTVSKWFAEDLPKTKLEPIRHVSEAITINRLFDIVVQVDEDNNY